MSEKNSTRSISRDQFELLIHDNEIVFMDFWAEWCAPCKQFSTVYEKVAKEFNDVVFAKINIEEEAELAETFQIRSIPHVVVFKQGIVIYSEAGSMPESTLKDLVKQAKDADVSAIKDQLDED
jgi:thioredoxin 1